MVNWQFLLMDTDWVHSNVFRPLYTEEPSQSAHILVHFIALFQLFAIWH